MQAIVILKEPGAECSQGGGRGASYAFFTIGCFILHRILTDIWIENYRRNRLK